MRNESIYETRGLRLKGAILAVKSPQVGELVEIECVDIAGGTGQSVGKTSEGFVVFFRRGLPGERLVARITKLKKSYAVGTKIETLEVAVNEEQAPCPHFDRGCGGCTFQNLQYEAQLDVKQGWLREQMRTIGGFENIERLMKPIVSCGFQKTRYRNRMEFSFQSISGGIDFLCTHLNNDSANSQRRAKFNLGLHLPGNANEVLHLDSCWLQTNQADRILKKVIEICEANEDIPIWSKATKNRRDTNRSMIKKKKRIRFQPGLQHLTIRHSLHKDEYLLNFTSSYDMSSQLEPICFQLADEFGPQLIGIVNSVCSDGKPVESRQIQAEHTIWGKNYITERICGIDLQISANAFFQNNTYMTEILYRAIEEAANLQPNDSLIDLYCGAGSITLSLAKHCRKALGVEIVSSAVEDARQNAVKNNLSHKVSFLCGDVSSLQFQIQEQAPDPDVVIVDPARPGLQQDIIDFLRSRCSAHRLIYVSCNSSTQARDLRLLCERKHDTDDHYNLISVQGFDLFPHTHHVENLAVLERDIR